MAGNDRRDTGMGGRDNEPIVELTSVPYRFEADTLVAELKANDIPAMTDHGDGGGFLPHLAVGQGHRVMVFESDFDAARALIERLDLPELPEE